MDAIERTFEAIKLRLDNETWKPGQKLPSLDTLANLCAVSRTTMWKALTLLQKKSLITTKRGGAIIAGPSRSTPTDLSANTFAWERLKEQLGRDLLLGAFTETALPPIAKLAHRYGTGLETVRKAIAALARERFLVRKGRSWYRIAVVAGSVKPTIFFISFGTKESGIRIDGDRTRELVESFEREALKLGYRSLCVGFNDHTANSVLDVMAEMKGLVPAGVIINPWNTWDPLFRQRWLDQTELFVRRNIPVILLDQMGDLVLPDALKQAHNFRVLRIAGKGAGAMVAEFLLLQGHSRIAFLGSYPGHDWVKKRYHGMVDFAKRYASRNVAVEFYSPDTYADQIDLTLALMNLDQRKINRLYRERLSADELEDIRRRARLLASTKRDADPSSEPSQQMVQAFAGFIAALAGKPHEPKIYAEMFDFLHHVASTRATAFYLRPFLRNVCAKSSATAWVCSDELMSTNAFQTLRAMGKKIPGEIAVVGFENWRYAHENQLTSYDFNMHGMIRQALLMIIDEDTMKSMPRIAEIDGFIVERRTTRRISPR